MYVLYIANKNYSSWSLRPWLLLRELGIDFQERMVPFAAGSNWEQFRQFSPTGRVPCLRDEETYVWDSLAITEYLAERHVGVWPIAEKARSWARCAAAEMHSGIQQLRQSCSMNCALRVELNEMSPSLKADISRIDELWNDGLNRHGGPFLAGATFTAVDAFFAPIAFRVQTHQLKLSRTSARYAELLLSLPAMKSWYAAALVEPWVEQGHEEQVRRSAKVLRDYRVANDSPSRDHVD